MHIIYIYTYVCIHAHTHTHTHTQTHTHKHTQTMTIVMQYYASLGDVTSTEALFNSMVTGHKISADARVYMVYTTFPPPECYDFSLSHNSFPDHMLVHPLSFYLFVCLFVCLFI